MQESGGYFRALVRLALEVLGQLREHRASEVNSQFCKPDYFQFLCASDSRKGGGTFYE